MVQKFNVTVLCLLYAIGTMDQYGYLDCHAPLQMGQAEFKITCGKLVAK